MPPFLRYIIPAIAGILFADRFHTPAWLLLCAMAICAVIVWRYQRENAAWAVLWLFIFATFALDMDLHAPKDPLPKGTKCDLQIQLTEAPIQKGDWYRATAAVGRLRTDSVWQKCNTRIELHCDSAAMFSPNGQPLTTGSQLAVRTYVNPLTQDESSYKTLMLRRGVTGRAYIREYNILARTAHTSKTPGYYASKLHQTAVERLERLNLDPEAHALAATMTLGEKRTLDPTVRAAYSRTGLAHILAISGLHVGIVFVLLNLLFYFLPAFPGGHIAKNIALIAAIWLFAAAGGASASVVRAALMFSILQISFAFSRRGNPLNTVLGAGFIMLALEPNYLFDISFQLSMIAVLALAAAYRPLFGQTARMGKTWSWTIGLFSAGLIATLAVAPLVSHTFGNVSVMSVLLNPLVILTAHIIVAISLLWTIIPIPLLTPVFRWLIEGAAWLQNGAAGWSASLGWGSWSYRMPTWAMWTLYAIYILLLIGYYAGRKKPRLSMQ